MKKENWLILLAAGVGVAAVTYSLLSKDPIPDGATVVEPFDKYRYLGKWNEVARLPNRIEKNIKHLTEEYTLNDDGTIKVVTRGYNVKNNKWREVSGKVKFAGPEELGALKVSYFGPFYAAYNVIEIDPDYQYAMVITSNLNYLWILSRDTSIPNHIKKQFLNTAENIGFAIDKIEWV